MSQAESVAHENGYTTGNFDVSNRSQFVSKLLPVGIGEVRGGGTRVVARNTVFSEDSRQHN